jgi:hypothetical protein
VPALTAWEGVLAYGVSPITVAGPWPIFTAFPASHACSLSVGSLCRGLRGVNLAHQASALCPNVVLCTGLFRPVDIIDPPAAREADHRESRAVLSFIGAAKMDLEGYAGTSLRRLSCA